MRGGSVSASGTDGEREALEQLREDEAALEREIHSAQAEATALLGAARTEAARIIAEARTVAAQEVARLRADELRILEAELAAARAGAEVDGESARRAAAANGPRAPAMVFEAALGRGS
jgi:vacuolar-type H+-ATPase subunit H